MKRATEILDRTKDDKEPNANDLKDAFEHILWAISFSDDVNETVVMIEAAKAIYSQALDMLAPKGEVNENN